MKKLAVITLLLLVAGDALAVESNVSKTPASQPQASTGEQSSDQKGKKKAKTPEWPRPYKSTEEISVDSTVPFPTDI